MERLKLAKDDAKESKWRWKSRTETITVWEDKKKQLILMKVLFWAKTLEKWRQKFLLFSHLHRKPEHRRDEADKNAKF